MNWFNTLVETYERVCDIAGVPDEKNNVLLPPGHMTGYTDVCVTIDGDGGFQRAYVGKENILIPCTEDSASRTSRAVPHSLHDQICYLATDKNKKTAYLDQLKKWESRHPKVGAVYKYIMCGTLTDDLNKSDIKTDDPKLFIRFSVNLSNGDLTPHLWEDKSVANAWIDYCDEESSGEKTVCYVTGKSLPAAAKHPKGINLSTNGAKLISCNDEANFTYRGRFNRSEQANAVSAEASHKAHSMLKYLISIRGRKCDTQAIVAWAADKNIDVYEPHLSSEDLIERYMKSEDAVNDNKTIEIHGSLNLDYSKKVRDLLNGYGNASELSKNIRRIAVIAVDAATTGRMAVTYYQDLNENDYLKRLADWHDSCKWHFRNFKESFIAAPYDDKIITAVFGEPKGEGYNKIKKQARERLLHCKLNGEKLSYGWVSAAVSRVSNPMSFNKQDGGWDKFKWEDAVSVACAITGKYFNDMGEEVKMELDLKKTDRDYLFGRLLAVADKIESHAMYLQAKKNGQKNDAGKRPTNAVRYMSAFAAKPFRTWKIIYEQLNPYIQQLNSNWYQRMIDEIMTLFSGDEYGNDNPLNGWYLMGYSLQRKALFDKNEEEENGDAEQKD